MHWRTYWRLYGQHNVHVNAALAGMATKLGLLRERPALCLVGLVASTHAGTHQIEGRIVGVHDGDTITLLDGRVQQDRPIPARGLPRAGRRR
jgi:hypothetical protein